LKNLSAEKVQIVVTCRFVRPWLFTRDELIAISKTFLEEYTSFTMLGSSFLRTEDPFESLLNISLFNEAATIQVTPTNFVVDFSQMSTEGHLGVFSRTLEFVQGHFSDKEISDVEWKGYVQAKFDDKADHSAFMKEFIVSDEIVSGGFIVEGHGIENSKSVRIGVEQSWGIKEGLFISLASRINRSLKKDDLDLYRARVDAILQSKGLLLKIPSDKT